MLDRKTAAFQRLLTVMDELRDKCPWDKKQTMETLRNLTIEETYELADAILDKDMSGVKEEIGDLMLHMIFYAKIAEEKGEFDIADALEMECEKLIKRHPHVYGDLKVKDEEEVKQNWEQIKLRGGKKSVLEGVPNSLPALVKAYRMQEKTKQVGFEWKTSEDVWSKVMEELDEFRSVMTTDSATHEQKEDEFGDLLFSLINFGRYHGIEAESALARVNKKFKQRFEYIESNASKSLMDMTLEEMDILWEESKVSGVDS
ncbi:MAG: nucleoside triphosphate pyrophosphohydrolase [Saprospiraceae bacterium]|nr:nucleoside triphosphate pyrophosphohydrolase [Saprospiraceae bacterium]